MKPHYLDRIICDLRANHMLWLQLAVAYANGQQNVICPPHLASGPTDLVAAIFGPNF